MFGRCVPAVLAMGGALFILALILDHRSLQMHARCESQVKAYLAAGEFETARVVALRGLATESTQIGKAQWLFYLAIAVNGLGYQRDAMALVNEAAPLDKPGCIDAHLLVVHNLLSSTNLTSQTLKLAERHLLTALKTDPDSLEANEDLARFYINTHELDKAQTCLMKIFPRKPDTALLLAITYDMQTNTASARDWADRAIQAYEENLIRSAPNYNMADRLGLLRSVYINQKYSPKQASGNGRAAAAPQNDNTPPQDQPAFWLGMVRLLVLNGKFQPALETLEQQMLVNSNAVYSSAIGEICAMWVTKIPPKEKDAATTRFQLIQKGLQYAPENLTLQLQLVQATHANDDSSVAAQALLNQLVNSATGTTAAWWHYMLWSDGRIRGDMVNARQHLQTAYQLAPHIPLIENDLAMDLSAGSKADQERALKLIDSVLEQFPFEPEFRDSRGQILARMGRYQEALTDLQFAAPRLANAEDTQKILADVYKALGMASPSLKVSSTKQMGQVQTFINQGEYASAIKILEHELSSNSNSIYASTLANTYAAWADSLPMDQTVKRFQLIQKGLEAAPRNERLMSKLIQIANGTGEAGAAAKTLLDQKIDQSSGESAAQWHFFLALDARQRGDSAIAKRELLKAHEISPRTPQIQVNLAAALVDGDQSELAQGLALIQPMVDQFPRNPDFRSIRGLILARLGHNQDAMTDLEFAVDNLENPTPARLELAKVYDAFGKTKQAEQQRRLAAKSKPQAAMP